MQELIQPYKEIFDIYLQNYKFPKEPKNLYQPVEYILGLGGKRLRSLLSLISADIFMDDLDPALPAALALEVFHNFTLVHDDIMDDAPLRRGEKTVHELYDVNTGILSGDVMLIWAYKLLNDNYDSEKSHKLSKIFTQMSIEVCEGQQMDMNFENTDDVSIDDYLQMITYKTAVLIATAMKMGAIVGNANEKNQNHLYQYGKNIGIAFQIQDDILDVFGEAAIGKQKAGDIIHNKKTYLYLKSLELGDTNEQAKLKDLFKSKFNDEKENAEKIKSVLSIYQNTHVKGYATQLMEGYRDLAFSHLDSLDIEEKYKSAFKLLGNYILERKF